MAHSGTALSVNLNKVALLRNSRPIGIPALDRAGTIALHAGAQGLTIHPRPDGRHIRPMDVETLASLVHAHPGAELNLEGNPFSGAEVAGASPDYPGFLELVKRGVGAGGVHQVTLVPDSPGQSTSDHGWELVKDAGRLRPIVRDLQSEGSRVSLFLDPEPDTMRRAAELEVDCVELYTEPYARAWDAGQADRVIDQYAACAQIANEVGLVVNAGHDLNLENLPAFIRGVPLVAEVSIGHALISDALWMGLEIAVTAYLSALREGR